MKFDIAVVGGGIHGVGVAQAAAAAGYTVIVLEQAEIAYGTSSRSSKLIHGGLRYLESGQYNLVRECLYERQLLVRNAPELVKLVPFYIPVYRETTRRPLTLRAGLTIYGALTGFHKSAQYHVVPRYEWDSLDGINTKGLQKVYQYWDAQTDDAELTRAVMHSAQMLGAELLQHAAVIGAQRETDGWRIQVNHNGSEETLQANVIVNAAGPWVNHVLKKIEQTHTMRTVDLVQGTHLVLDAQVEKGIYYIEAPSDRRAVFVMPWQGKLMVGTTEKLYEGDPANVQPTEEEITYLLTTLKHYFPAFAQTTSADVAHAFAGLRVLPHAEGAAFSRPRDTEFVCDNDKQPHLLSIYGGKLTAYRATAENVIKKIMPALPERQAVADTRTLQLRPVQENF